MEKVFERVGKKGKNAGGWIWQFMRVLVMGLFRVGCAGKPVVVRVVFARAGVAAFRARVGAQMG